jgi:hypothetical protein
MKIFLRSALSLPASSRVEFMTAPLVRLYRSRKFQVNLYQFMLILMQQVMLIFLQKGKSFSIRKMTGHIACIEFLSRVVSENSERFLSAIIYS